MRCLFPRWGLAMPTFISLPELSTKCFSLWFQSRNIEQYCTSNTHFISFPYLLPQPSPEEVFPPWLPRALHPQPQVLVNLGWLLTGAIKVSEVLPLCFTKNPFLKIVTQALLGPKALRCKGKKWMPHFLPPWQIRFWPQLKLLLRLFLMKIKYNLSKIIKVYNN